MQHHNPDKIAEDLAVRKFGMKRAKTNQPGYDGILPDGRRLQVKSKKHGAHPDSGTYVDLSEKTVKGEDAADCLLVVFVDFDTGDVMGTIGPVPMEDVLKKVEAITRYRITMNKLRACS
ncbi:MAG: hypothetical protein OXH90_09280 [Paracoccaceae bacterium]|nr:hypothetical protein [Paracoccaceae bacterium]MDE2915918.1 hypothetical protein [Paracoccaceae bacterium]